MRLLLSGRTAWSSVSRSRSRRFLVDTIIPSSLRAMSTQQETGIFDKIAFLGAGKMAQAMIKPLISSGMQPASGISIYDVSKATLNRVQAENEGVSVANSIPELVKDADLVMCAVKPQNLEAKFFDQLNASDIRDDMTLLSIVAGKPLSTFLEGSPKLNKVARCMPNTPAQIGKGITVWCGTDNIESDERNKIKKVLGCFGKTIFVDDESFIDMSTSISGSGPAYIFMLMEAMVDAGVHMGFSRETATTLVHHTLLGSTLYAMETKEHPAILRNSVTSPAGTTASAMYELENGRFRTVIKDAIWACYRRSLEMGGHDSNVGPGRTPVPTVHHHIVKAPFGEMDYEDEDDSDSSEDEKKN